MLILMSSRGLLHFLLIITYILLISEGKGVGGRRGDSFGIPSIVDYFPHPHQEEEATTQPPKAEGAIIHPQPDREVEAITIKVEADEEQRRESHNVKQLYPGETPPPYPGAGRSAARYPGTPKMLHEEHFRRRGVTNRRLPGYFCGTTLRNFPPIYPRRRYYRKKTLGRKLIPPQSVPRAPDNMNYGGLTTETNVLSKPEKKRIRNPKKNRKNNRRRYYRKNTPRKNTNDPHGKESVTDATDVSTHSSEATTEEAVTIT